MSKRPWQPKVKKRARKHGFLKRMTTRAGQHIVKRRRLKGRSQVAVSTRKK